MVLEKLCHVNQWPNQSSYTSNHLIAKRDEYPCHAKQWPTPTSKMFMPCQWWQPVNDWCKLYVQYHHQQHQPLPHCQEIMCLSSPSCGQWLYTTTFKGHTFAFLGLHLTSWIHWQHLCKNCTYIIELMFTQENQTTYIRGSSLYRVK